MSDREERPLSYWISLARKGFENDFNRIFDDSGMSRTALAKRMKTTLAYVSKVLNGRSGNYQLETMAKWARAIDAVVQIRLIKDGEEVVRVVDYETAAMLDAMSDVPRTAHEADAAPLVTARSLLFFKPRVDRVAASDMTRGNLRQA